MIELLMVSVLVAGSVAILSLTLPKASEALTNSRRRSLAMSFAAARMQDLKAQPYALLDTTPRETGVDSNFPISGIALFPTMGGCDCSREDLTHARYTNAFFQEATIVYTRHECIHLVERVGAAWQSTCSNGTMGERGADKGLKKIHINVTWSSRGHLYQVNMESMAFR